MTRVLSFIAFAALLGCQTAETKPVEGAGPPVQAATAPNAVPGDPATPAPSAASAVTRIIFLDQVEACDCTKKRIADTWAALQDALGPNSKIPVETIHVDTQPDQAEVFTVFKPLMVTPGIYFLDSHEAVLEALQGEITVDQIRAVLK